MNAQKSLFVLLSLSFAVPSTAVGQVADPFAADPFDVTSDRAPTAKRPQTVASPAVDDPFGGAPSRATTPKQKPRPANPFGSGDSFANDDPFASDDPFGSDPFANRPQTRRPKPRPADPFRDEDPFAANGTNDANPFSDQDPFGPGRPKPRANRAGQVQQPPVTPKVVAPTKPRTVQLNEAHERIRAKLGQSTTFSFIEIPLEDAIREISEQHDLPVVVNRRALEEIGLSADEPVSLSLKNVSLRAFLRLMLRDLDLTYMIKSEVLQITTIEAAEQNLVVEMYRFSEDLTPHADTIVRAVTASVAPAAWDVSGGPCSVVSIENVLIVSATEALHEEVRGFLYKLKTAFDSDADKRH